MSNEIKGRYFGKAIITEVKEMVSKGMTQREIAEHFGLKNKYVIKDLLKRDRKKERLLYESIMSKSEKPLENINIMSEKEKISEIKKLRMEVELLRSFLQVNGRK